MAHVAIAMARPLARLTVAMVLLQLADAQKLAPVVIPRPPKPYWNWECVLSAELLPRCSWC